MDSRCCPILLVALAVSLCFPTTIADRKFGCLFEDELCTPYEFCVNDGVFGQCQELAGADLHTYDISSSALQRLRILLQKLAHRGMTWQDDLTQQVISRELSKLRHMPLHHPVLPPASLTSPHAWKQRPELNQNLQQYLSDLGFLNESELPAQPEPVPQRANNIQVSSKKAPSSSKPKHTWKEHTIYSIHKGDGQPPITKVFTKSGEGRHPKLGSAFPNQRPGQGKLLSGHLERLLNDIPTKTQHESSGVQGAWPKGKLQYFSSDHPAPNDKEEAQSQLAFGSKASRPNLDKTLYKAGSIHHSKQPFGLMDDHFLQSMLNQLGSHSMNLDSLMGTDLDDLVGVINGALQEVHEERPAVAVAQSGPAAVDSEGPKEANGGPLKATVQNQEPEPQSGGDTKGVETVKQKGQTKENINKEPVDKHSVFFSKLLNYLNMEPFDEVPNANSNPKTVGLESVQSRTTQGQAPVVHHWEEKTMVGPAKEGTTLHLTSGPHGPDAQVDSEMERWMQELQRKKQLQDPQKNDMKVKTQLVHVGVKEFSSRGKDRHFGYIITGSDSLTTDQGLDLMERLAQRKNIHAADLTQLSVLGPALTFRVGHNPKNVSTADLVEVAVQQKPQLEKETGLKIVEAGVSDRGTLTQIPVVKETRVESGQFLLLSLLCMLFILVALAVSGTFFCVRQRSHLHMKEKLASLGTDTSTDATATYQELCRQRMAIRTSERVERPETLRHHSRLNSVSSQFSDGPAASPSTRSSTSSWCEEPVPSNMDISTGHMILSYMEDHLKNKNRLEREWEALCSYQAEPSTCSVGHGEGNGKKNRPDAVVAYDHSRITLKAENNHGNSDYINASPIMDHDPRNPTYIASQGPLPSTVADFWQMVWESGCVVIVMLTPLSENGVKQCHHYWPDEGSDVYHIYEVNLVSEHIWCDDFLVRSFYLKNLQTNETRTVTQFHYLSWSDRGIPTSARTLLDFRRKVNKCYRGRSCPIIVHCSDGAGRTGTYILIDMVLNKMAKGAKEIDIAATLEHLRDQRAGMVQTKEQFEFALTAVAEEVNAILKALPQ
ncbi:receptor-type tyrosine-protein phosphatase N2 [Boleophthalmus pectinirostris]|uniref:receptor-type tyrosine-protein phosphatase N2 n=1 Tax=Boleophthalmus pectinirostris TaxID=150288 RepID=UPI002431CAFB|nr:receptor-type tyrosine-protein phosphatase N2 [Boleophthalmus pectinirostris]